MLLERDRAALSLLCRVALSAVEALVGHETFGRESTLELVAVVLVDVLRRPIDGRRRALALAPRLVVDAVGVLVREARVEALRLVE